MSTVRILTIDPDIDASTILRLHLEREAFEVISSTRGESGLELAYRGDPDLILLDVALPDMDGLEVCRLMKANARTRATPVLIVTARASEADKVMALEGGADDFISKPFSFRELVARIHAVLRRCLPRTHVVETLRFGDFIIDVLRHAVLFRGRSIELTSTEFRILQFLVVRAGIVVPTSELSAVASGDRFNQPTPNLPVHVSALRRKLKDEGGLIRTIHGFGYKLNPAAAGAEAKVWNDSSNDSSADASAPLKTG